MDGFEDLLEKTKEIGFVALTAYPIIYVKGIPSVRMWEIVMFESGEEGMVLSLSEEYAEIVLFSLNAVPIGTRVVRTGNPLHVPMSTDYIGKIVDPLGRPFEENVQIKNIEESRYVDALPLKIDSREKVKEPLLTGVSVVDMMVPLGKGQREMVLGDRKVGKTAFLMQLMLAQAKAGTLCIYAGIGRKKMEAKIVEAFINDRGIRDNVITILSFASDPLGLMYVTPYTAMTMAEYFRDKGRDVLVILDDLTTHAKFFREMSLLNKKFPGRESYPGDIFYTHGRMFERAGNFKHESGPKSITCIGVAETVGGDISGYIQTNLMSITDGHIFFDEDIFEEGRRPSVNTFLSVTRVGRQTQTPLRWGVNRELTTFLTLLEKTSRFSHFGGELNEGIRATLEMGERINAFFTQEMGTIISLNVQIIVYTLIWSGSVNHLDKDQIRKMVLSFEDKYSKDEQFRQTIDTLIEGATDFNKLLADVTPQAKKLMEGIVEPPREDVEPDAKS